MTRFSPIRQRSRVALAAVITLAAMCAALPAQAADDDDDDVLLDTKIFRNVMKGLGLRKDGESIEYRERSPLVLPPSKGEAQLPKPEDLNSRKVANWPVDPDLKRSRERKEAERRRKPAEPGVDDKALPTDKLTDGPVARKTAAADHDGPARTFEDGAKPSSNKELGVGSVSNIWKNMWAAPKEEYTSFAGEPARATLTEPPRGYRTPSPAQPYGVGTEKWSAPKVDRNEVVK